MWKAVRGLCALLLIVQTGVRSGATAASNADGMLFVSSADGFTRLGISAETGVPVEMLVNGSLTQFSTDKSGVDLKLSGEGPLFMNKSVISPTEHGTNGCCLCCDVDDLRKAIVVSMFVVKLMLWFSLSFLMN